MREIKFRAWDKDRKQMYSHGTIMVPIKNINHVDDYGWELMQYTGLKDENEMEIYEGDILKCDEEYVTEVKYDDGAFFIDVNGCDYDYTAIGWAIGQDINECYIIGNIYENPELLK